VRTGVSRIRIRNRACWWIAHVRPVPAAFNRRQYRMPAPFSNRAWSGRARTANGAVSFERSSLLRFQRRRVPGAPSPAHPAPIFLPKRWSKPTRFQAPAAHSRSVRRSDRSSRSSLIQPAEPPHCIFGWLVLRHSWRSMFGIPITVHARLNEA